MSELISGKEALIALANGEDVRSWNGNFWRAVDGDWQIADFLKTDGKFRLKPRTITLNGIEVPAPFEPKQSAWGEIDIYVLSPEQTDGWDCRCWEEHFDRDLIQFGAWRTEEEIKQVVAALRSIFK